MKLGCGAGTRLVAWRGAAGRQALAGAIALSCGFAAGCGDSGDDDAVPSGGPENVTAVVSPNITTVITVSWTTPELSTGYVEYGPTSALGRRTPLADVPAREHSALLLGLTADTPYYYRVVTGEGGLSAVNSTRTGYLPTGMPQIEVVGDGHDGLIVATVLGANPTVLVLNAQGQIVWYWRDDRGLSHFRARLSRDKTSILYNAANVAGEPAQNSELVRVALDGSESSGIAVPYLAHDFIERADGNFAAVVIETRELDGAELKSNAIVEATPGGSVTEVWNALDCFDPALHPSDEPEQGWTLANSLDHDESADAYYFGMRGLSSIARIDRATRACEWVLGTAGSTLAFADGSAQFVHQHQFHVFDDRVLVHDNDGATELESRVIEYQLDHAAGTATEVWSFTSTPPVYTPVLGEVERLAGGDTFIDWSIAGQLERVTPGGETVWKLNTAIGAPFGYVTLIPNLYGDEALGR